MDKGDRIRGILNIGREDVDVEGLLPEDRRLTIIGASSDHLLLDLTDADEDYPLGTDVTFLPSYSALLAAMTSSYVEKRLLLPPHAPERARREAVMVGRPLADPHHERFMRVGLSRLGYAVNRIDVDTDPDTLAGYMRPGVVPIAAGNDGGRLGLAAAARAMTQFGVIWVDALITTKDLSALLSRDDPVISQALAPERIVLIGAREIEPGAIAMIKRMRIATFTMEEVSLPFHARGDAPGVESCVPRHGGAVPTFCRTRGRRRKRRTFQPRDASDHGAVGGNAHRTVPAHQPPVDNDLPPCRRSGARTVRRRHDRRRCR